VVVQLRAFAASEAEPEVGNGSFDRVSAELAEKKELKKLLSPARTCPD
jgi:hypothetical protein